MRRFLARAVFLAALGFFGAGALIYYYSSHPLDISTLPKEFEIRSGSSLRSVSHQLVEEGVLTEPWLFIVLSKILNEAKNIKAGNYLLDKSVTPYELLSMLSKGDVKQNAVTFIEGWTFQDMLRALAKHDDIAHDTAGLQDQEILARLGLDQTSPEGLFFPSTYFFAKGASDMAILRRAHESMARHLADVWGGRMAGLPLKASYEALILASIIEKETGDPRERPLIAAVFVNRLRLGYKLQTDPTVIYGMGPSFDGNLRKRDLLADTPYNTYTRYGLPPTPIAMPGLGSLEAAVHPADSSALYFVAKGDGSHQFSDTLAKHNAAVNRFQRRGRP